MTEEELLNLSRRDFYKEISLRETESLEEQIRVLSNQISASSEMRADYFLQQLNREMNEREFYAMCLGFSNITRPDKEYINLTPEPQEKVVQIVTLELFEWFDKQIKRFEKSKFASFFIQYYRTPLLVLMRYKEQSIPPVREYYFNYYKPSKEFIMKPVKTRYKAIFKITFATKRKAKKAAFIRGYRDHGSRLDDATRDRRLANKEAYLERIHKETRIRSLRYKNPSQVYDDILSRIILRELEKL